MRWRRRRRKTTLLSASWSLSCCAVPDHRDAGGLQYRAAEGITGNAAPVFGICFRDGSYKGREALLPPDITHLDAAHPGLGESGIPPWHPEQIKFLFSSGAEAGRTLSGRLHGRIGWRWPYLLTSIVISAVLTVLVGVFPALWMQLASMGFLSRARDRRVRRRRAGEFDAVFASDDRRHANYPGLDAARDIASVNFRDDVAISIRSPTAPRAHANDHDDHDPGSNRRHADARGVSPRKRLLTLSPPDRVRFSPPVSCSFGTLWDADFVPLV